MRKKELALEVIRRLKEEYPDADCTLDYDEAWKLLVSVRLAAQCTDARVNVVVEDLYAKFPDVNALADAPVEEIEEIVRPCGLGKSKARDISACMKILRDEYNGKVPDDFDKLLNFRVFSLITKFLFILLFTPIIVKIIRVIIIIILSIICFLFIFLKKLFILLIVSSYLNYIRLFCLINYVLHMLIILYFENYRMLN